MRIGHGYDVHRLLKGVPGLVLCGVEIPFDYGLSGHSDADVAVHALMDALLGALALGDIGLYFPDTAPEYEGISSILLLKRVMELVRGKGYRIGNADITVIAQRPRLAPYITEMRARVARAMDTGIENVSVKATTEEGLGFTGTGDGIAAHAVVLLEKEQ